MRLRARAASAARVRFLVCRIHLTSRQASE
jgi:hypothetical protein